MLFISSAAAQVSPENGPSDETGYDDGSIPGSVGYVGPEGEEGSRGSSKGSVNLSTGAQIAIIVVAVLVAIIASAYPPRAIRFSTYMYISKSSSILMYENQSSPPSSGTSPRNDNGKSAPPSGVPPGVSQCP